MGSDCRLGEIRNLVALADVQAVQADLPRRGPRDLGADLLQAGLVAVSERNIAAARRKLDRQRAADAAGGPRHRRGGSLDRGHL